MSRVVNLNSPGKSRSQSMRTAAELIRRLSQKSALDDEVRDMASMLVFCFRDIDEGVDDSVAAWEKRDYWVKAARFRDKWSWSRKAAMDLEQIIRNESWEILGPTLARLLPYFDEIKIARFTRTAGLWQGAYLRLMQEEVASK